MTRQLKTIVGIMIGAMLALVVFADSEAREPNAAELRVNQDDSGFSLKGHMVGQIRDNIRIGHERVFVSKDTPIYVLGEGFKKLGYYVKNYPMYVSGTTERGVKRATFVVIRKELGARHGRGSVLDPSVFVPGFDSDQADSFTEVASH